MPMTGLEGTKLWASMTDDGPTEQIQEGTTFWPVTSLNHDLGWSFGGHAMVRHTNRRSACTVPGAPGDNDPTP